jgi:cytochrome c oxidase subunit 3
VLHEQFQDLTKQEHAARLGMWVFLGSELLLFAALFTLYAAYRTMYPHEFAVAASHDNVLIGSMNTIILLTSSLTVALSIHAVRAGHPKRASILLLVTMVLGALFLALKLTEWGQHLSEGIAPGVHYTNTEMTGYGYALFFTLYYVMTGLHAIHVTIGMIILGWLAVKCWREEMSSAFQLPVELGGLYWHLVDLIWIFLWPLLYLVRG